jgi:hypothetical protein
MIQGLVIPSWSFPTHNSCSWRGRNRSTVFSRSGLRELKQKTGSDDVELAEVVFRHFAEDLFALDFTGAEFSAQL